MVPSEAETLCFVLMPFVKELLEVYTTAIRPAAETVGLRCERADDIEQSGVVLDQIDARIKIADVIVADLTRLNPNVLLEVGFARRSGKPMVLISQDRPTELPFDLRHFRIIVYQQSETGLVELRDRLSRFLAEAVRESPGATSSAPDSQVEPVLMRLWDFQQGLQRELEAQEKEIVLPDPAGVYRCVRLGYQQVTVPHAGRDRPVVIGDSTDHPAHIPMWRPRLSENARRVILFAFRSGGAHPRCIGVFVQSGVPYINVGDYVLRDIEATRVLEEVQEKRVMEPNTSAPHLYCLTKIGIARAEELQSR